MAVAIRLHTALLNTWCFFILRSKASRKSPQRLSSLTGELPSALSISLAAEVDVH